MISRCNFYDEGAEYGQAGSVEAKAGETILIKLTRDDNDPAESLTTQLMISEIVYTPLKEKEDLTITVKTGDYAHIEFTAPKNAWYEVYAKEVPEKVDTTVAGSETGYDVMKLTLAEKRRFDVGATFTPANEDETKSFKLYASEITPTEITGEVDVTVAREQKAWFTFTAPDDGRYVFSDNSADVDVKYEYCGDDDYANTHTMPKERPMRKGDKLTFAVVYSDKKTTSTATEPPASASFKLSVAKIEPTAITAAETSVELAANTNKWYSYTAAKSGEYDFSSDSEYLELYTSMASDSTKDSPVVLVAGESVFVKVTNDSSATKTVKVTVDSTEAIALTLDTELEVGFTADEIAASTTTKYLAFKAPKTGYYKFTKTAIDGDLNASINQASLYSSIDDYFIKEGNTVFVKISTDSYSNAVTATIKVENGTKEFSCETIAVDQQKLIELVAGENRYLEFTAPSTGTYSFFSTSVESSDNHDSYAYLYDDALKELATDDDSNGYPNFKIDWKLEKGQTVYLKVMELGNNDPISFNVFVKEVK